MSPAAGLLLPPTASFGALAASSVATLLSASTTCRPAFENVMLGDWAAAHGVFAEPLSHSRFSRSCDAVGHVARGGHGLLAVRRTRSGTTPTVWSMSVGV